MAVFTPTQRSLRCPRSGKFFESFAVSKLNSCMSMGWFVPSCMTLIYRKEPQCIGSLLMRLTPASSHASIRAALLSGILSIGHPLGRIQRPVPRLVMIKILMPDFVRRYAIAPTCFLGFRFLNLFLGVFEFALWFNGYNQI